MEFLGIGPTEILLIVLIAFVVLGPDRIPGVMRQLGKWLRQAREMTNNLTRNYGSDIRSLTDEIAALQNEIRGIQTELGQFSTEVLTSFVPPAAAPPTTGSLLPPLPQSGSSQGAPPASSTPPAGAPAGAPSVVPPAPDDRDSYSL